MNEILARRIGQLQRASLAAGAVGAAACLGGAFMDSRQAAISYLFAYLFWLGLSLGCLCVAMIHHLTGGRWGDVTRRFLEAGYMTLPLMALLFLPILAGAREIYPWARAGAFANTQVLRFKAHYLNPMAVVVRALVYFVIWLSMALALRRWSRTQDQTKDATATNKARTLSGPGVVIYTLTVTFAWVDWMMSLESDWFSTMFAVIICGGQILAAFAFVVIMLAWFRDQPPFSAVVEAGQFHQLGNLMLTFVMFWTYVSFGQLLIIWSGNLPNEISWYLHRIAGHWKWIACLLGLFNFFLPFFLLLFRAAKRNVRPICCLAALVFLCQIVSGYWLVEPAFFTTGVHLHWLDFAAVVGVGGLWIGVFAYSLHHAPLLIQNDPRISYSFSHA